MKRNIRIILLIAAMLALVLLLGACGSEDAESVSLEKDSGFQTVYIRGQQLKLSGAMLTVDTGKEVRKLALDAEGVSVSGYDSSLLGKQTLTIEYGGASTEVTVTVVEQLAVSGAQTDYLVGGSFDAERGVAKITDTDGKTKSVPLTSEQIRMEGFDSSAAGEKQVRIVYTEGATSCEGTLTVHIFEIEDVDFYRPNKVTYSSHYKGGPDASGGRFVLRGKDGALKRELPISSDMISGLDLSAVTESNPTLKQTLTVTYGGETYTYDVQLRYTDVSLILDHADAFLAIAWDGPAIPSIPKTEGELALRLMQAYVDMPEAEQAIIDEEVAFAIARAAMVYGFGVWAENIRAFDGVFSIENGKVTLELESYDAVKASLSLFAEEESAIYTVAPLLLELIELYGERVIYENDELSIHFADHPVMDSYALTLMEAKLTHVIEVYDLVGAVGKNWRTDGLAAHYDALSGAIVKMFNEDYLVDHPDMYYLMASWREEGDFFDILYSYLYETDKKSVMNALILYGLPGEISRFYTHVLSAQLVMDDLVALRYFDTTNLLYHYYKAYEIAQKLEIEADTAEHYLYTNVPVNYIFGVDLSTPVLFGDMLQDVRMTVIDLSEGLLEQKVYEDLVKAYLALVENVDTVSGYTETEAYAEAVGTVFSQFVALTPVQQYNALSIFNLFYKAGIPKLAFDDADENAHSASRFTRIINSFMKSGLSPEKAELYDNLVLSIEIFANRFGYDGWQADFTGRMDALTQAASLLSGSDKAFFDAYLADAFTKYSTIREGLGARTELGEWADDFAELYQAFYDIQTANYHINTSGTPNYTYFLSSFERALDISERILKDAPDGVVYAYYHEPLFKATANTDQLWSCEYAMSAYRSVYMDILLRFGEGEVNLYEAYFESGMDAFLALYYDMISAFLNKSAEQTPVFNKDEILAILSAFSKLNSPTKSFFVTLQGGADTYGAALELFLSEAFTEKAAEVAHKLFTLENSYYSYEVSGSGIALETLKGLLAELTSMYAALGTEDQSSFAPLYGIYTYYLEKCANLPS